MLEIKRLSFLFVLLIAYFLPASGQHMALHPEETQDFQKAVELYKKEQYGNAQQIFDKIWQNDLQYDREARAAACYYAAQCAINLYNGDVRERLENFAALFELNPKIDQLYLAYANNLFSLKRYRDAAEFYDKVDAYAISDEDKAEYTFKKAYAYFSSEQQKEAKKLFFSLKDGQSSYAGSARYYYAHILYNDSNYQEALANFLPLREDEQFGALVPYYLAHIYHELENYQKLIEVGQNLVETATPSRAPEIAKLVADAFYQQKNYRQSVKYLEMYSKKGGRMRMTDYFQEGYANYQLENYGSAITAFNKISAGPDDLLQKTYYHLGDSYLKTKQQNQALTAFKAAAEIEADPKIQEDAFYNYAKLSYALSSPFKDAISTLNEYLQAFPNSKHRAEINAYLANLYITTKDYEKAIQAIERTGLENPEMQAAYQRISFYRGNELFLAGKYGAAADKYRESLNYPRSTRLLALAHYWIALSNYNLLEYDKALEELRVFRNSPGAAGLQEFTRSYYNSAYAHYKKFDFQPAAADFRSFVNNAKAKDPRLSDAYLRLGDAYFITGGTLLAADFYQKAINLNTSEPDYAYFKMAQCLGLSQKEEKKINVLRSLMQKFPKSTYNEEALYEIALTYLRLDQYEQTIETLAEFERKFPQSDKLPEVRLKKGLVYSNTDQNNKAIGIFKDVVQQFPNTQQAIEAIKLAELVYTREERINEYLDWVANIDFVDFQESELDSTAYNAAFDQYSRTEFQKAFNGFSNYLDRFENGIFRLKANYYRAQSAERLKRAEEAAESYKAIAEMPRNQYTSEALYYLATYDFEKEAYAKARHWYLELAAAAQGQSYLRQANQGIMRAAYKLGKYDEVALYADLVINHPEIQAQERDEAMLLKARAELEAEQFAQALQSFKALETEAGGEALAESMYGIAFLRSKMELYDSSNQKVNQLIRELPSYKEWKMRGLLLMAKNFWKLNDIFQANYILDFIEKTDYSPEMNQAAADLRAEIQASEARAIEKKKALIEKQSVPITLDPEKGLMIIDMPEEAGEELEGEPMDQNEDIQK